MTDRKAISRPKALVIAALSLVGGTAGILVGRLFGASLQTAPAWIGPAIMIGSIALVVVGLLLLPAAARTFRRNGRGTAH